MKAVVYGIPPKKGGKRSFDIFSIVINNKCVELRILSTSHNPFNKAPFACECEYKPSSPDYMKKRSYTSVDENGEVFKKSVETLYADGSHFTSINYEAMREQRAKDITDFFGI